MDLIIRLAVASGVILLYRWMLHLSTPRDDWRLASIYLYEAYLFTRRGLAMIRVWLISLVRYIPTKQVEQAWSVLRSRIAEGQYGEAGT